MGNQAIKFYDRLESPGAKDLATVMQCCEASGQRVIFGIVGDVAKAHRQFKHKEAHRGVLACKSRSSSRNVWLNKRGTFGVAPAAYHWARLAGLMGRFIYRLMEQDFLLTLIYADDLHLAADNRCVGGTCVSRSAFRRRGHSG